MTTKELVKALGDSRLYYNDDLGFFEIHRFDEVLAVGDDLETAIKEMEAIEL